MRLRRKIALPAKEKRVTPEEFESKKNYIRGEEKKKNKPESKSA